VGELSNQLLEIWKRLLENEELTAEDHFYSAAGETEKSRERKATALMVFIKNVYGVEFSTKVLDAFPTVSNFSEKLKEAIEARTTVAEPFHESDEENEPKKDR
jgi:alkanesulfonate monooxygenase SsuD/methylene tetrahydromethanopterin reductase-like flavin-dependent oxidoreductase (luciferase family)